MTFKLEGARYFHFIDSAQTLFYEHEMARLNDDETGAYEKYKMKSFLPVGKAAWERMDQEERAYFEQRYVALCAEHGKTPNPSSGSRKKRGRPAGSTKGSKRRAAEEKTFEVQEILGHRITSDGVTQYLVKWSGFDETASTWENAGNLGDAKERVAEYQQRLSLEKEKEGANEPVIAPPAVVVKQELPTIEREEVHYLVTTRDGHELLLLEKEDIEAEERRRGAAPLGGKGDYGEPDGSLVAEKDSSEVEVLGMQGPLPLVDLPHPRELCRHPHTQRASDFCSNCCCFVCELLAQDCPMWESHCHAKSSQSYWKECRKQKRKEAAPTVQLKRAVSDFFEIAAGPSVMAPRMPKVAATPTILEETILGQSDQAHAQPPLPSQRDLKAKATNNEPMATDEPEASEAKAPLLDLCDKELKDRLQAVPGFGPAKVSAVMETVASYKTMVANNQIAVEQRWFSMTDVVQDLAHNCKGLARTLLQRLAVHFVVGSQGWSPQRGRRKPLCLLSVQGPSEQVPLKVAPLSDVDANHEADDDDFAVSRTKTVRKQSATSRRGPQFRRGDVVEVEFGGSYHKATIYSFQMDGLPNVMYDTQESEFRVDWSRIRLLGGKVRADSSDERALSSTAKPSAAVHLEVVETLPERLQEVAVQVVSATPQPTLPAALVQIPPAEVVNLISDSEEEV